MDLPLPAVTDQKIIPLPPAQLRFKVAGTEDADWFVKSGHMSVQDLTRALASIGRSFGEFNDLLEWGCGCGRILRHLSALHPAKRIYGNDIDQEALSWVNQNLSWVETTLTDTDGMPPLPYADSSFDLIFNHSVLSHLDETYQDAWLTELKRLLRPDGILILTIHGRNAFQAFLDALRTESADQIRHMEDLSTGGILHIKQSVWSDHFPDFYHTTYHDVEYVFNHWSKFLTLRSYIPGGSLNYQDMIVLQKPTDDLPTSRTYQDYVDLHRRNVMGEPGLIASLRRKEAAYQKQLQRIAVEREFENATLRQVEAELQSIYASRSWLLTKPWRYAGRLIKRFSATPDSHARDL